MNLDNLQHVLNSEVGADLREFLQTALTSLKNIDNLELSLNPIKVVIEVRAQKKAKDKLEEILSQIIAWDTHYLSEKEKELKAKKDRVANIGQPID